MTGITKLITIGNKIFYFSKKFRYFQLSKLAKMLANFSQAIKQVLHIGFSTILHFSSSEESNKQNELFNSNPHLLILILK